MPLAVIVIAGVAGTGGGCGADGTGTALGLGSGAGDGTDDGAGVPDDPQVATISAAQSVTDRESPFRTR